VQILSIKLVQKTVFVQGGHGSNKTRPEVDKGGNGIHKVIKLNRVSYEQLLLIHWI